MENARRVCKSIVGEQAEQTLFEQHGHDVDEYIDRACSRPADGLRCAHCKTNSGRVEMLQTRAADEGMTAFFVCGKCGLRRTLS
jgi:DNA-directed RNA polymerase subunit M/transcription elongation factor TFIIS